MTRLPAIPENKELTVDQAARLAAQVERWAAETDDVTAVNDGRARLDTFAAYLRGRHEAAATELLRASRKLELRVGVLLGEAEHGGDRGNQHTGGKSQACDLPPIPKDDRYRSRKVAAHAHLAPVAAAIERGVTRNELLRTIDETKAAAKRDAVDAVLTESRQWIEENVPKPTDVEGDLFRARVWDSILVFEEAARSLAGHSIADVRRAIDTEPLRHVREDMTRGLRDALDSVAPYRKVLR